MLVAASTEAVTDDEIATFYEENKATLFAVPTGEDAATADEPKAVEPEIKAADEPKAEPAPAGEPAAEGTEEPQKADAEASPAAEPGDSGRARRATRSIRTVAFMKQAEAAGDAEQPAETGASSTAVETATEPTADAAPAASAAADQPAAATADNAAPSSSEPGVKPLAEVREEIRGQLGRQAADRKLGEIFDTIAGRIASYAEELDLAVALGNKPPAEPDLDAMAAEFGLDGLRSEFVSAAEAVAAGGIGTSFQLSFSERFGVRQQRWIDMVFSPELPRWRPLVTRDIAGNRYLSWKSEERPAFTPPLAEVRPEVERVWRLMEARPLAKKRAEKLLADADGKSLAEAVAGQEGLEATTAGPFTWLTRGTAPFGSAPMLSDPDGVQMAGEGFMEAVFSLPPGGTTVAFNEPQTVCYAIRLVSLEPGEELLRQRFLDEAADPRRIAAVAETDVRGVYARWLADVTRRQGVEWQRPPR